MSEYALKYEFAYLANTTSVGFTSSYPGLDETGTTGDGAKWYLMTDFIEKPDDTTFNFGKDEDQTEQLDSTGIDKGIAVNISLFGQGRAYVKDWLIDHPDAFVNSIQVRITDVLRDKNMGIWEIKQDSLDYLIGGECVMDVVFKEYNPTSNCLQNTLITDNHRKWFPSDGKLFPNVDPITGFILPVYFHPLFKYCDDIKPQFLQNFLFAFANGIRLAIITMFGIIAVVADFIVDLWNNVFGSGGTDPSTGGSDILDDIFGDIFKALIGCGRSHPGPFVRNYFINACSKCGVEFESNIFNDPSSPHSRYYNTCVISPLSFKGLKESKVAGGYDWIDHNGYNATPIGFAYDLKRIFNAKFKLEDNKFSFHSKDTFPPTIIFDFTGADAALIVGNIRIGRDAPARDALVEFQWGTDPIDMAGNEARHRYNAIKDWTDGLADPDKWNFNGTETILIDKFAPARFTTDGIDRKLGFKKLDDTDFWPDNLLLLEKDVLTLSKLLIWDGVSDYQEAGTIKLDVNDMPIVMAIWTENDYAAETLGGYPDDTYFAYNYPLYFDPINSSLGIKNLYDLHKIDDPTLAGKKVFTWTATLELCKGNLDRLIYDAGLGDGIVAKIDYLVKLTDSMTGKIDRVSINYSKFEIVISGTTKYVI